MLESRTLPSLPTLPPAQASSLDNSNSLVSVSCYVGNPNNEDGVGNLSVPSASQAGPVCNNTFLICKGKCYGCFDDFDYSEEICVDNSGKKYLR
jgi:hypothetical protein